MADMTRVSVKSENGLSGDLNRNDVTDESASHDLGAEDKVIIMTAADSVL